MSETRYELVVLGASAGGLQAISQLLCALPSTFSLPLIVCIHLHASTKLDLKAIFRMPNWLKIKEAEDKDEWEAGVVYIAPSGYHLLIERDGTFSLSNDELVSWARPSIDVLFESAASARGDRVVGVLLTGANHDGADGLQAIRARGGLAIVQDPEEAEVPSMPMAALAKGPIDHTLRIAEIARKLGDLQVGRNQKDRHHEA